MDAKAALTYPGEEQTQHVSFSDQHRIHLRVYGLPAPQGSKKAYVVKNRAVMREASDHVGPWRSQVAMAARLAVKAYPYPLTFPIRDQVAVEYVFLFPRPKSHFGSGSRSHVLRADSPYYVSEKNKGDFEKLLRSTNDGLSYTTGGALLYDDSLVVALRGNSEKRYCSNGELPGAILVITPASTWPTSAWPRS